MVLLSHCLLDENVRYLGGAGRAAGVPEVVEGFLAAGIGIHQLPCPEQRAWGGVRKPYMLLAFGARGPRAVAVRTFLRPFLAYTRWVYRRLARSVVHEVRALQHGGVEVVGMVGIGGSPSCGVRTTLDLPAAVDRLTRIRLAELDRARLNDDVVAPCLRRGEGQFVCALRGELDRAGIDLPLAEHDQPVELGLSRPPDPPVGRPVAELTNPAHR